MFQLCDKLSWLPYSAPDLCENNMQVGLKYYEDMEKRIPRAEVRPAASSGSFLHTTLLLTVKRCSPKSV